MNTIKYKIGVIVLSVMFTCSLFVIPTQADESFVAVSRITGVPTEIDAGARVILDAKVEPSSATNQTITWKVKDTGGTGARISGNILSASVGGSVIITATVDDGISVGKSYTQDFRINVGKNDVQKLAIASAAVRNALDQYNATNKTTKQEITLLIENAIANSGVVRVSVSWSTKSDFSKTEATLSSTGIIKGQIDLISGMRFSSLSLNKTIPMLPKQNEIVKEESQTENKQPNQPKTEESIPKKDVVKVEESTSSKVESTPKKEVVKVEKVFVNNKRVDQSNYTVNKETGTIVFKEEFINTLPKGENNVTVQSHEGETKTDYELTDEGIITLQENKIPSTSTIATEPVKALKKGNSQMIVPIAVGLGALVGLAIFYKVKKAHK